MFKRVFSRKNQADMAVNLDLVQTVVPSTEHKGYLILHMTEGAKVVVKGTLDDFLPKVRAVVTRTGDKQIDVALEPEEF